METHIYRDENGTVCVDSPRNKIKMLVPMIRDCGGIDETIAAYPHLTHAQLHAAMAYYYNHQEEIDGAIRRDHERTEAFLHNNPESALTKRLRDSGKLP
jgi:uncharacterized protein (DUF433 family)